MPDDHSKLEPLLPIPNRTVKRFCADDSAETSVKVGYCQAIYSKKASRYTLEAFFYAFRANAYLTSICNLNYPFAHSLHFTYSPFLFNWV